MDDSGISWAHFRSLDPPVTGKVRRDLEILIIQNSPGRDVELGRHRQHYIGPADLPTFAKQWSTREVHSVALYSPTINPLYDCFNVLPGEAPVVQEFTECRIRMPRR